MASQRALARTMGQLLAKVRDRPAEDWTVGLTIGHLELLDGYWRDFVSNHVGFLQTPDETTDGDALAAEYTAAESTYLATKGQLYDIKARLSSGATAGSAFESPQHVGRRPRLPKIELQPFSGMQEDWESFRDLYRAVVHNEDSLTEVEKLYYLKSHVRGEAKSAIDGLILSDANYTVAWAILEARYDNKRVLIRLHLGALLRMKPMKEESAMEIQRLIDELETHRTQLSTLGRKVDGWDDWLVTIADHCMDPVTRRDWEEEIGPTSTSGESEYPAYSKLKVFLQNRSTMLKSLASSRSRPRTSESQRSQPTGSSTTARSSRTLAATTTTDRPCPACGAAHYLGHCEAFKGKSLEQRRAVVIEKNVCRNCLRDGHLARDCPSPSNCRVCGSRHHTMIHDGAVKRPSSSGNPEEAKRRHISVAATTTEALVTIGNRRRPTTQIRALLDPCSEATFLSTKLIRRLGDGVRATRVGVSGVAGLPLDSAKVQAAIQICIPEGSSPLRLMAYGLSKIGIRTPAESLPPSTARLFTDIKLADPSFNVSGKVDMVLGADAYSSLVQPGTLLRKRLLAQQTRLGWTITGTTPLHSSTDSHPLIAASTSLRADDTPSHEELVELVRKFWSLEDVPRSSRQTTADAECERRFLAEHQRRPDGRYMVPLPLKPNGTSLLGESLSSAHSTLSCMHRRMARDSALGEAYKHFMQEYADLGHMTLLNDREIKDGSATACYIPHHAIWQRADGGKKLRVVFNASRPTTTGHSLNDILHPGPKLQTDLAIVITRWRLHRKAFCADIKMMFRQVRILPQYTHLQRILWSPTAEEPAKHYALQTVTYGEASAPYLSLRTLRQLGIDEGDCYPEAVRAIAEELYVDDFLCGADNVDAALKRRDQLSALLRLGGFTLKKWVANDPALLEGIAAEDRLRPTWLQLSTGGPVNELGIVWDPVGDRFLFNSPETSELAPTKRIALSELARIFDPAGWLAPVTVTAKMLIQDFWRAGLAWDEPLPEPHAASWNALRRSLRDQQKVSLPRWIHARAAADVQLHVFADASRKAMGASLYHRSLDPASNEATVGLLWAKTKLTSMKGSTPSERPPTRMTVPRLELRAALIAARLLRHVAEALGIRPDACFAWSDSQIVLHWLGMSESTGNHLVDDYVAQIQEHSLGVSWRHVSTHENPADIASRGMSLQSLVDSTLWWRGPCWLRLHETSWPRPPIQAPTASDNTIDIEPLHCLSTVTSTTKASFATRFTRFSSLHALVRAMIRVRRWRRRLRGEVTPRFMAPPKVAELRHEYLWCVHLSQLDDYPEEIRQLKERQPVLRSSPLRSLAPFIHSDGLLRVGGRLSNSDLPFDERHPVILSGSSHLALLVVRWAHDRSLHGGFRSTYAHALQRAWIVGGRRLVKRFIHNCVVCVASRARPAFQAMAPLPAFRVTIAPAFSRTGVDYAGPFPVLFSKGRGAKTSKGYIAVFVCLSTKAIHLELAGDLTTATFLGALTRFIGRRGRPHEMWSDNGTNFRGADAELGALLRAAEFDWGLIEGHLAREGVQWRFIPPGAPHFGGLWESTVKSTKTHLRRIAGPRNLTFEEFSTLLVDVERVLNSRPLVPLSGDPEDLEAITPAHLALGRSLVSVPEPSCADAPLEQKTHWDLVRCLRDRFWKSWSREYLNTLQQRAKWTRPCRNIEAGDLVVVLDPSLLKGNGRWPLGRVIQTYPGSDGLVRAATVKTATGTYDRPTVKLARLPVAGTPPDP